LIEPTNQDREILTPDDLLSRDWLCRNFHIPRQKVIPEPHPGRPRSDHPTRRSTTSSDLDLALGHAWGNAASWASSIGGGDHNPVTGSVAWWGSEQGGGFGHVAYVEQVNGGSVYIRADNYSSSGGYTTAGWIAASSVDLFLHPHDIGTPPNGAFVSYQGAVYRMAGSAPIYVSSWSAFGGPQPTTTLTDQQWASLPQFPADGTFITGAQRGEVYRIAGGAPVYVSTWSAFGGQQPTMSIDVAAIDNAGGGGVWNHLNYRPADGTL
jgi:surface antigen